MIIYCNYNILMYIKKICKKKTNYIIYKLQTPNECGYSVIFESEENI